MVLFPGQNDTLAYPLIIKGLKSALDESPEFHIEYFFEYMDRRRYSGQGHYRAMFDLYRQKYSDKKIDLVITVSAQALDFVANHRDEIFPQAAVVFTAVFEEQVKKPLLQLKIPPPKPSVLLNITNL